MSRAILFFAAVFGLACLLPSPAFAAAQSTYQAGVARVDITPEYPIRLTGYGNRRTESEGVAQRLWAKALALRQGGRIALLLTVDNCGIPEEMRAEVLRRLQGRSLGVTEEGFAIASSHTHTGPALIGVLPNIFSSDIPPEHLQTIERYTRELTDWLEQVSLSALEALGPATLSFAVGHAGFAGNRRIPDGPVDQDLPVLRIDRPDGGLLAVLANYACHCTTLTGQFNQIHGDWAGFAQEFIERDHPGATALIAIGCGAEANPNPRPGLDYARDHGEEIAAEVRRLLGSPMRSLGGPWEGRVQHLRLPFAPLPAREEWERRAAQPGPFGYHAIKNLARLDRGERLPTELPYLVQTWSFGGDLAMVFLPGEVVADYALRLKEIFERSRIWVNGYSNGVPCYIPSRRVLAMGGYEAVTSMTYYDRPAPFAPEVEDMIIEAVQALIPAGFEAKPEETLPAPSESPR
jgi:neutral ceramidase